MMVFSSYRCVCRIVTSVQYREQMVADTGQYIGGVKTDGSRGKWALRRYAGLPLPKKLKFQLGSQLQIPVVVTSQDD